MELIKRCDKCQRFRNIQRLPVEKLAMIRPFSQWGINIISSLPIGKGQVKFLLVAINYFTKWVEAKALATITKAKIRNFVWKNIIAGSGYQ